MLLLKGAGLPNVRLASGYTLEGEGEAQSVSYSDLVGLYDALALAIACRGATLTASEFRFLRRRLEKSQNEIGELVGVTGQAVANWEKSQTPVPVGSGRMVRLAWLAEHAPELMPKIFEKAWCDREFVCHGYVLGFEGGKWVNLSHQTELEPIKATAERETAAFIASAGTTTSVGRFVSEPSLSTVRKVATT